MCMVGLIEYYTQKPTMSLTILIVTVVATIIISILVFLKLHFKSRKEKVLKKKLKLQNIFKLDAEEMSPASKNISAQVSP